MVFPLFNLLIPTWVGGDHYQNQKINEGPKIRSQLKKKGRFPSYLKKLLKNHNG